jgi:hypothetical protein
MSETAPETVEHERLALQSRLDRFRSLERYSFSTMNGHGIDDTMISGVLAASQVVGKDVFQAVMRGVRMNTP